MKITNFLAVAASALVSLSACEKKEKNIGEKIGKKIDDALESREAEEIRDAAEEIADGAKKAAKDVSQAVKKAADELKEDSH